MWDKDQIADAVMMLAAILWMAVATAVTLLATLAFFALIAMKAHADVINLSTGEYIMDMGDGDAMNLSTGEYFMDTANGVLTPQSQFHTNPGLKYQPYRAPYTTPQPAYRAPYRYQPYRYQLPYRRGNP